MINPKQKGISDEKPKSIVMSFYHKFRNRSSNVAGGCPAFGAFFLTLVSKQFISRGKIEVVCQNPKCRYYLKDMGKDIIKSGK
ncbi:hypothetical protein DRN97_12480 [Methanosarcinales archaeon]|nr:MAG: hypothetical protein DRN97_12480 [Methanosarcinales archaeon]